MHLKDQGFLLNHEGRRWPADPMFLARELDIDADSDVIDAAMSHRGCVFVQPAHSAMFIELYLSKVAPLAALQAFYQIKETAPKCVVLSCQGDTWSRLPYELFPSPRAALQKMEIVARGARRRAAAKLQCMPQMLREGGADVVYGPRRVSV